MLLQPTHQALTGFPYDTLPTPETWKRNIRPTGWAGCCPGPEELFGEWLDRLCEEEEVILSPALDAAYGRAIDAAFEKVMDGFCGPDRRAL